jgi:PKD repeat protein
MTNDWQFGDGNGLLNAVAPVHSYVTDGNYRVNMLATSDNGCIDTVSKGLDVWPMPVADFKYNDSAQCLEQNYKYFKG